MSVVVYEEYYNFFCMSFFFKFIYCICHLTYTQKSTSRQTKIIYHDLVTRRSSRFLCASLADKLTDYLSRYCLLELSAKERKILGQSQIYEARRVNARERGKGRDTKNKRIDSMLCNSNIYQMSTKIFESKNMIFL